MGGCRNDAGAGNCCACCRAARRHNCKSAARARCLYTAARSAASCPRKKRKKEGTFVAWKTPSPWGAPYIEACKPSPHPTFLSFLPLYASGCACVFARWAYVSVCTDIRTIRIYAHFPDAPLFSCVALLTTCSHSFKLALLGTPTALPLS